MRHVKSKYVYNGNVLEHLVYYMKHFCTLNYHDILISYVTCLSLGYILRLYMFDFPFPVSYFTNRVQWL